jgi:MSHA biogenesis protein MshJ
MKARLKQIAARIDALSLRERVILFLSVIILVLVLAEVAWLTPLQAMHRQITQRFTTQNAELLRLQDELRSLSGQTGPGQLVREELNQVRERLASVNSEISKLPVSQRDDTPLTKVLVYFLRRHEGLVLVRTATLAGDSRTAPSSASGVTRQGVELVVSGSYPELVRYVQTLERSLPTLRWGGMRMDSENRTAELTLQVWLVGATP